MTDPDLPAPDDVPPVSAEFLVDSEVREECADEPDLEERTYPSTIGGAFYLLFLAMAAFALVIVALGSWRTGVRLFGGVLIVAAAVRLVLGSRDAGMLAVRNKGFDAALLTSVGVAIVLLASSIPDQPA